MLPRRQVTGHDKTLACPYRRGVPEVSVVVPTFRRPAHVLRAVGDALSQTLMDIEVIVLADGGGDEETLAGLAGISDDRLRVVVAGTQLGNAGARNAAIAEARAPWIALLDDDDGWMPDKLAVQLAAARASALALPIVTCRLVARHERAEYVWPRSLPRAGQPVAEYLFCRRKPGTGEGMVQTSTILAPRALFEAVPFDEALPRYVDLDWMLRAAREPGVGVVFAGEAPLSVWSIDEDRARLSNVSDWGWDARWAEERRDLLTPRAHAAFLLTMASIRARRARDRRAFLAILRRAVAAGPFSAGELAFHVGNAVVPPALRGRLTARRPLGTGG